MSSSIEGEGKSHAISWNVIGYGFLLVIPVLFAIYSILYAFKVLFGWDFPPMNLLPTVGSADGKGTGEIGDTLGGLLGPILTSAALIATLIVARAEGRRSDKQFAAQRNRMKTERAETVVAWIAETEHDLLGDADEYWHGVVVQNGSGSVVTQVDIAAVVERKIKGQHAPTTYSLLQDRESIIPPGTWFVPFKYEFNSDSPESSLTEWRRIVPVAVVDGQMKVVLEDEAVDLDASLSESERSSKTSGAVTLSLHTRLTIDQQPQLFYKIDRMRFTLNGQRWERDLIGICDQVSEVRLVDGEDGSYWNNADLEATESNQRRSAQQSVTGVSRKTKPSVAKLVLETVKRMANLQNWEDAAVIRGAIAGYRVDPAAFPGIEWISLPSGSKRANSEGSLTGSREGKTSSRLRLKLVGGNILELNADKDEYPKSVKLLGYSAASEDAKTINRRLRQDAVLVLRSETQKMEGQEVLGDVFNDGSGIAQTLQQPAEFWIENMDIWIKVLIEIATKAREYES